MKNKIILTALTVLSICSCAQLGKYKAVETVSDNLYGDVVKDGGISVAEMSWREFFSDGDLKNLIDTALVRNKDLAMSYEHICQAEAQLRGAKLSFIPTLGVNPGITTSYAGDNLAGKTYSYNVAASSTWQLDVFRLINNLKASKVSKSQMEDYYQAVQTSLVAAVANTYYAILMLDAQISTANAICLAWDKSVETVKHLKDAGLADQVAVSQYEANRDNFKISIVDLTEKLNQAENSMCLLLGRESGTQIKRGKLADQKLPSGMSLGVPANILTLRPDVRAAQRDMELAFHSTKGALLNFFPTLSLNGSIGLVNPVTGELSPMSLLANVGAGLVAPILSAGQNSAAYRAAQSRQREARLAFDKALLTAGNEVNDAYFAYNSYTEKSGYYETRVASLDKARKDTEYLMKNSLDKTYLDVLFAYSSYFDSVLSLIANRAGKMQASVDLYAALGGGSF